MGSSSEQPMEFQLDDCPKDGISSVKYSKTVPNLLIASSWDATTRFYDTNSNNLRMTFRHAAPVLDCDFMEDSHVYSGGLDQMLKSYDVNTGGENIVGQHDAPIRCVHYCADVGLVVTGGWDFSVRTWDPRARNPPGAYTQPDKVYTLDTTGQTLVVGTAGRKILIWDLRNMGFPQQKRESSLKYQTRAIRCFPNGQGFVQSSIEGRVAVEFLDPNPMHQKKKYAFKCHRIKEEGVEKIFPVNSISFHTKHNTFASGGSDGFVNIWDGFNKKRLCQFHRYPTSISSISFSSDGEMLAIASSYMFEQGEMVDQPEDTIFIRHVTDQETKPK